MAASDPERMLDLLEAKADERKVRLFAVACARRVLPSDPVAEEALGLAERFADGLASRAALSRAAAKLREGHAERAARWPTFYTPHLSSLPAWQATRAAILPAARNAAAVCASSTTRQPDGSVRRPYAEEAAQADLLRDIFGNPFCPFDAGKVRTSPAIRELAEAAVSARQGPRWLLDPKHLSVLADAAEEAGNDEALTSHLRQAAPHVYGCWALDALLQRVPPPASAKKPRRRS